LYDALFLVSFGGPEQHDDVIPFLENVLRGRNVPRERMLAVAEHYYHFDGKSPINDQNRELIAALRANFAANGLDLPIYWGNRNWHPFIAYALNEMRSDGRRHVAVFVTSAYGSYSGCRQYREDIGRAGIGELVLEKLPHFCLSDDYITVMTERVCNAYTQVSSAAPLAFTAHSIPMSMAETSPYVQQLRESCARVATAAGVADWSLVYQSRSGPPTQPWLEPDILEYLRNLQAKEVVVCPIGFCSDHMEVLYDLDTEAATLCTQLGIKMVRTATAGSHPLFVDMIRKQILESVTTPILSRCFADCCPTPARPPTAPSPQSTSPA
jgi:protoporphyrin/coproporphyrin ferrochelatase